MEEENKNTNTGSTTPIKGGPSTMDPSSAILSDSWEWGNLLDFSIGVDDDQLILPWETEMPLSPLLPPPPPPPPPLQPMVKERTISSSQSGGSSSGGKVRKRDHRLICDNYLAERVPCACPEMDKLEEEQAAAMAADGLMAVGIASGGPAGRKKARAGTEAARCQVPGCEVDISQLKGYHRRHRICLSCSNSASVLLDGEPKRYCQQCGKFHVLADYDEGKRSCRRKLERHNKRRRRRPSDQNGFMEKENDFQDNTHANDLDVHDEQSKESLKETSHGSDSLCLSNKSVDDTLQESGERNSLDPSNAAGHINSLASFAVSSGAQIPEKIDNTISSMLSPLCENKSAYSTVCPTGRISFKLYDWNPAEFPRRLRRQIFHWLDSMPVELEGYLRPGCTMLTVFISMPDWMWSKLSKNAVQYLQNFVKAPESLFFGRGNVHIHLNNTIFQVLQDGNSLVNVKMEVQVPRLHYVHPVIFEAGKPIELLACGSNLFQPNFRFLVSFGGKYLVHESEEIKVGVQENISCDFKHEMLRIRISHTDSKHFGPAFIEVENESGLSNFIPILLADKHVCTELEQMEVAFKVNSNITSQIIGRDANPRFCGVSMSRLLSMSGLLLDIAWLLKDPHQNDHGGFFSIGNIKRLNSLFQCLIENESVNTLEKVHSYANTLMNGKDLNDHADRNHYDVKLFRKYMDDVKEILHRQLQHGGRLVLDHGSLTIQGTPLQYGFTSTSMTTDQEKDEVRVGDGAAAGPVAQDTEEKKPLLVNHTRQNEYDHNSLVKWHLESCNRSFEGTITKTRLLIFAMTSVVVCFGFCIALSHPHKVSEFAVSVRRCVFGIHKP